MAGTDKSPARNKELERELGRVEGSSRWIKRGVVFAAVLALAGGAIGWRMKNRPPPAPKYLLAATTNGDVIETVQSTGTVQPLTQVQVGAQVSGRVVRVLVDYNSEVKQGDLIAEIDPTLLGAQVAQNTGQVGAARASSARAEANLRTSKIALDRAKKLREENLASQADVDTAQGQYDALVADLAGAKASITQLSAQLNYSRTSLAYTRIFAPIDGVVISRSIDPGQTVAASFQAPTLFVIAQDLQAMRIMADIDEADVGKLKEGMTAEATVDAFPGEIFKGKVQQVRFSPNTTQGVVTYSAVIDVANPEKKLRPGMTATVTVKTHESPNVLRIPNAALRFKPSPPTGPDGKPKPTAPLPALPAGKARVFLLTDTTPGDEKTAPTVIDVGITDGVNTEVRANSLRLDVQVVIDETDAANPNKNKRKSMF